MEKMTKNAAEEDFRDCNFMVYLKKRFTFRGKACIIIVPNNEYGGVPDSIAGERKDKHTADGVPA